MTLQDFLFLNPILIFLLVSPIILLVILMWMQQKNQKNWQRILTSLVVENSAKKQARDLRPKNTPMELLIFEEYVPPDNVRDINDEELKNFILNNQVFPVPMMLSAITENWEITDLCVIKLMIFFTIYRVIPDDNAREVTKRLYYIIKSKTSES
jgi:hypothetical protein